VSRLELFRRDYILFLAAMVCLLPAGGCSPERDEYSFPPMIYDEEAFLREIEAADDLISLSETRANYAVALKKSAAVEESLERKWEELSSRIADRGDIIGRLTDELELWGFDFLQVGPDRYRFHLLFRVVGEIRDNYGISILGRLPDPSRLAEPYRDQGYRIWYIRPLPPTSFWEEGEFVVIRDDQSASELPYELWINMDTREGIRGRRLFIGEMCKIEDTELKESDIAAEEDPFRLYRWLTWSHARSGSLGELARRRYREVAAGLPSEAEAGWGIDYLGAELSRVGPHNGRVRMLFRPSEPLDRDYYFTIYGIVAPEDRAYLSEARRKEGANREIWYGPIYPPPSEWPAGEPVMVTRDLDLQPIPYDIQGYFYDRRENQAGPRLQMGILPGPDED